MSSVDGTPQSESSKKSPVKKKVSFEGFAEKAEQALENKRISCRAVGNNDQINCKKINRIFLVMEFTDSDLRKMMSQIPLINIDDKHITTILYNALCAINFLHSANLLHRDLKPANILVDSKCGVKICDYGLARVAQQKDKLDREYESIKKTYYDKYLKNIYIEEERAKRYNHYKDEIRGFLRDNIDQKSKKPRSLTGEINTRWYRAPEIILTDKDYGKASDIWSLGIVLSELMYCSMYYKNQKNRYLFPGTSCFPISPVV